MSELSTLLTMKASGTTDCVWDTLRGAVNASPDGDVYLEPRAANPSYFLAGPTGGPLDGLRGRML